LVDRQSTFCRKPNHAFICRLARDQIRGFVPRKSGLQLVDWIQLILYIVAYILCVLMTPLDDELTYEWGRNPRFYDLTFTSNFKSRLNAWLGMNVIRTICAGIGWLLVGAVFWCIMTCTFEIEPYHNCNKVVFVHLCMTCMSKAYIHQLCGLNAMAALATVMHLQHGKRHHS
jgi:hypothetical protein